jgi:hypothetical protein
VGVKRTKLVRCQEFRVYAGEAEKSGLFVQVRVFAAQRDMLKKVREESRAWGEGGPYSKNTGGVMRAYRRYLKSGRLSPCLGSVNLYRQGCDLEIVAHEFTHAMFAWADRKKLFGTIQDMPTQEPCCYALGRMVERFTRRAYALGIYEVGGRIANA